MDFGISIRCKHSIWHITSHSMNKFKLKGEKEEGGREQWKRDEASELEKIRYFNQRLRDLILNQASLQDNITLNTSLPFGTHFSHPYSKRTGIDDL